MRTREEQLTSQYNLYSELTKAQDKCYDAKEDRLFDMCVYHINIVESEEYYGDLTIKDKLQILNFAKDVYQIAVLKNELNPIV